MLSIKNLTKIYKTKGGDDTKALDNVTLDFPETGMIFLLGKSGSGKSTLLNLVGGLDFPTSGEIILKGRSSKDFSQSDFDSYRNTYIGFIFQEYNILNEFNVEQNIALAIELQGKKVTNEAVENLLEQVDLTGFGKRKPNTLSGGQKQRIAIARALIKQPNIIMADEPTGALDSKTGEQVFETLKKLSSDKLVIVVSHDRDFAERFGDRIIELKDGKVLSDQTKHPVQSKSISDNITIINPTAIKINDSSQLTKQEFDKLYTALVHHKGTVFIAGGENAVKSMKLARISEEGQSDEFKKTADIALKQYDGSKTTFIRSKMPMKKSIKMGLSSLKTKPIRLAFTMFLSIIAFTMFGVASGLMLYNSSHTYSEALRKTDYKAEMMRKTAIGKSVNREIDNDTGRVVRENSYNSYEEASYGVEEINELNKNGCNLVYIPIGESFSTINFANLELKENAEYYRQYYRLTYISDASEETFKKLGYELYGHYPVDDDEILLPKIYGDMLVDGKAVNKSSYAGLIGEKMYFSLGKGSKQLKICGFFDAGDVPETYKELKNKETTLDRKKLDELSENLQSYIRGSFNCVVFGNANFYDEYVSNSGSYRYINAYNRMGLRVVLDDYYDKDSEVRDDEYYACYTDDIVNKNKDSFNVFDLDGKEVSKDPLSMKEDEVYLSYYDFNNRAYQIKNSFLNSFIYIGASDQIMRYMPTYYAYYSAHYDEIEDIRNSMWGDNTAAEDIFNQFKEEYIKAYKINEFVWEYRGTEDYNSVISEADRQLIEDVTSYEKQIGTNTTANVNNVYNILYNRFDNAVKNYLPYRYLQTVYDMNEELRLLIDNDNSLRDLPFRPYDSWTNAEVNAVKQFLDENCQNGLTRDKNWEYYLKGYTFQDYSPITDDMLKANKNLTAYYASSNGSKGKLKVVGYYRGPDEYSDYKLLNKEFVDKNSSPESYGSNTHWEWGFETDYETPADARYRQVMVKTDYTQEQVTYMLKSNNKSIKYDMTSSRYSTVNFIVSLVNTLKKVFFWVGVGFGAFSALMLLNFITVSISSKKRDIGILRAIGARKSDVFKIFFAESLFIGGLCAILAIIFTFIAEFFLDRYFVTEIGISILQFSIITVGLVLAVAIVIAFIATIIPVTHSSRKPPVESIRAL